MYWEIVITTNSNKIHIIYSILPHAILWYIIGYFNLVGNVFYGTSLYEYSFN